jgi:hypothetical protein
MNTWLRSIIGGLLALVGTAVAVPQVGAETASLEIKRLDAPKGRGISIDPKGEFLVRLTRSQGFYMQIRDGEGDAAQMRDPQKAQFDRLVKKQPEKYQAKQPFRGVAKLGSDEYLFVFDMADDKSKGFDRLYFDRNHNGDLTDDEVLKGDTASMSGGNYVQCQFSRIDLTVNADGEKVDYAFCFQIYTHKSRDYSYSSASLNPLAYREGKITLDGKERRVVLVDFNSNGRFDDAIKIAENVGTPDGQLYPRDGDILMVDPNVQNALRRFSFDVTPGSGRYHVSKLVAIDGRFYDLKITPAGDKLTLTPSKAPVGNVTNPNESFAAIVYSDKGFVQISGGKDKPCALPEGEWKLLNYTIDVPKDKAKELAKSDEKKEEKEAKKSDEKKGEEKKSSLLSTLSKAILGSSSMAPASIAIPSEGPTYVSASATGDYKAVKVTEGKTIVLPFGPPYKPTVKAQYYQPGQKKAELELLLVGSAGEICSDMRVNGGRPSAAHFTIKKPDGKTEAEGDFQYG